MARPSVCGHTEPIIIKVYYWMDVYYDHHLYCNERLFALLGLARYYLVVCGSSNVTI